MIKKRRISVRRFERRLLVEAREAEPSASVHVVIVQRNKWLNVSVTCSEKTRFETFRKVCLKTVGKTRILWPEGVCCPIDHTGHSNMVKTTSNDGSFWHYSFWLPIPPARTKSDFKDFFPVLNSGEHLEDYP